MAERDATASVSGEKVDLGQGVGEAEGAEFRLDVALAFAPSLGYFGTHEFDCMEVHVNTQIRELRLHLDDTTRTFLNLRGLKLLFKGQAIDLEPGTYVVAQSSVAGNLSINGADSLLNMKGIHSAAERSPWWQVVFDQPVSVDMIRLWNRADGWGVRSRSLCIRVGDAAGNFQEVYRGLSMANLHRAIAASVAAAGVAENKALLSSKEVAAHMRTDLLAAIAERIRSGSIAIESIDWRSVVPLLDVWGKDEPSDDEWTIIAAFLLAQQLARSSTSMKGFSLRLNTQMRLLTLQQEINKVSAALGQGSYMLTRHGVMSEGLLRREPEKFLAHLDAVINALRDLGREPVLAYGTLLGAVREGNFIAHDDDVDLLYRARGGNRSEVEAELAEIQKGLREKGFRVVNLLPSSLNTHLNMHVIDARSGAVIDVFPCWEENGLQQMHMESMKIRGIDPAIMYPATDVSILGRAYPAPAKPEGFLLERYGSGWGVSDQFFEWPWPLKEEETQ